MKDKIEIMKLFTKALAISMYARDVRKNKDITLEHPKNNLYDIESFYAGVHNALGYIFSSKLLTGNRNVRFKIDRPVGDHHDCIQFRIPLPHHKELSSYENSYHDFHKNVEKFINRNNNND